MSKIKVLIIDDSALVRQILTEIFAQAPNLEVVGTASDPLIARDKIKQLNPDVLTLDVEMPKMDGVTFLSNLMRLRPMPVVMVSSLTESGADITLQALELGAFDFVTKPKIDVAHELSSYSAEIIEKVTAAATANVSALEKRVASNSEKSIEKFSADAIIAKKSIPKNFRSTEKIIAIGASTGGTEAIKDVLMDLPVDGPGVVITQHIPEQFSKPFAERMNRTVAMQVCEATDGQQILAGHAYIAPGSKHLMVERDGARYICRLKDGEPVNRHKPAVDVLFRSVAQHVAHNAVGAVLTGMGDDGARGLLEMHEAGALTLVQDEKTSVVWGMPGESVKLGGVDDVVPLNRIAKKLMENVNKKLKE